jgi:hypothetical protein
MPWLQHVLGMPFDIIIESADHCTVLHIHEGVFADAVQSSWDAVLLCAMPVWAST